MPIWKKNIKFKEMPSSRQLLIMRLVYAQNKEIFQERVAFKIVYV